MPWWIWLLITVFMLLMVALGVAIVVLSAIKIARVCFGISEDVSSRFERLHEPNKEDNENPRDPLFTLPIKDATNRYERTHTKVIDRHQKIRENHRSIWQHWDKKSLREEDIQL